MTENFDPTQTTSKKPRAIQTQIIDCPLCHHPGFKSIVTGTDPQWGIPGTFHVVECNECRHRYMNPAPTAESLPDCYPPNYGPHQNRPKPEFATESQPKNPILHSRQDNSDGSANKDERKASGTPWYLRWLPLKCVPGLRSFYYWLLDDRSQILPTSLALAGPAETLANAEKLPSKPRAFELGCAAGAYLQKLKNQGWEVEGLELSESAVSVAREAGLNVHQGILDRQPRSSIDNQWVCLWMVLEHVPNPVDTLTRLHEKLASEGTLAFSVPNAGCWEPRVFGRHWDAWDLPRHLHHFRPTVLKKLLEDCGFTEIRIQHQRNVLNIVGSTGVWWTSIFPHSRLGQWLRRYPHQPRLWLQLLTAPLAHALSFIGQGGRLTVTALKAERPTTNQAQREESES